jgi:hypothetical protein
MMFGFGDAQRPDDAAVAFVEQNCECGARDVGHVAPFFCCCDRVGCSLLQVVDALYFTACLSTCPVPHPVACVCSDCVDAATAGSPEGSRGP